MKMQADTFSHQLLHRIAQTSNQPATAVFKAKAAKSQGVSLESFLASLIVAGTVFLLELLVYAWLRARLPQI